MQRLNIFSISKTFALTAIAFVLQAGVLCPLQADTGEVDTSALLTASQALGEGESLEASRQWRDAIRLYEAALEKFPEDDGLTYALRRTRVHFGIERRYADNSFEKQMLTLSRSESLDLMEDVLGRVQTEYVDPITATKFVAHGTESFYMALGNSQFLAKHFQNSDRSNINAVRQRLIQSFWNRRIGSRVEARMTISEVCDLAADKLNLASSVVVMEYLFGGCNALDDYSNFLTPDSYNDLFGSIQGEFVGIGIEMEASKGKGMQLMNVLLDSPAESGGLRPGDFIVEIDGRNCRDFSTDEAARLLRGTQGSRVNLKFEDPDGRLSESQLIRRPVQIKSVTRALILDDTTGVGYIRMTGFQNTTEDEMEEALRSLERQGMKSLIWDLRGNPGGLLDTAAAVIDRFIEDGVLVSTEGRSYDQTQVFRARSYNTRRMPLVLLVDEGSASASEIVAGAIKDHGRGTIVGRKTYGKWSVQSIIHLPGGTGLKLTTAKFFSPNHMNYAGKGLQVDEQVSTAGMNRSTMFRGKTSGEIVLDPDVARGMELLERQFARK